MYIICICMNNFTFIILKPPSYNLINLITSLFLNEERGRDTIFRCSICGTSSLFVLQVQSPIQHQIRQNISSLICWQSFQGNSFLLFLYVLCCVRSFQVTIPSYSTHYVVMGHSRVTVSFYSTHYVM